MAVPSENKAHNFPMASASAQSAPTIPTLIAQAVSLKPQLAKVNASPIAEPPTSVSRRTSAASFATTILHTDGIDRTHSKREKVKLIGRHLKHKVFHKKEFSSSQESQVELSGEVADIATAQPLFQATEALQRDHAESTGVVKTATSFAKNAVQTIKHPLHHPKKQAAKTLTASEHPYLDDDDDAELLEAHDELLEAAPGPLAGDEDWQRLKEKRAKFDELQKGRDAKRSAWALGKHVNRVRAVPSRLVNFPRTSEFNEHDARGRVVRWQWERYFGHLLLYYCQGFTAQYIDESNDLPFNRDELLRTLERVLVASAPWQMLLMHVRKIYLWEDRWLTTKWLLIYLAGLKTGLVMSSVCLWIIFITVKHRLKMDDIRFMKESKERENNPNKTVQMLSELANRHGGENWIDPLLDETGPLIVQQLGDLADFLEMLYNFYTWRKPRNTIHTLIFWLAGALLAACTSTEFGKKCLYLVGGMYFFFSRPIASLHPKYRKAVSLFRVVFWQVPTNAEYAFEQLRTQAQNTRVKLIEKRVDNELSAVGAAEPFPKRALVENGLTASNAVDFSYMSVEDDDDQSNPYVLETTDVMSFRGVYDTHRGHLVITTTGMRFVKDPGLKEKLRHPELDTSNKSSAATSSAVSQYEQIWSFPYDSLLELRKTAVPKSKLPTRNSNLEGDILVIEWLGGAVYKIAAMKHRDMAFDAIIGFSGMKFQALHPVIQEAGEAEDGVVQKDKGRDKKKGGVFDELSKLW